MKIVTALLLALTIAAISQTPYIDPNTGAERIYDVPIGTRYGLVAYTDTMHVTTTEQGWALDAACVGFMLINRNDATYTLRFSNVAGTVFVTIGSYSTLELFPPGAIKTGNGIDSLFLDGSASITLDIIYWVAE